MKTEVLEDLYYQQLKHNKVQLIISINVIFLNRKKLEYQPLGILDSVHSEPNSIPVCTVDSGSVTATINIS